MWRRSPAGADRAHRCRARRRGDEPLTIVVRRWPALAWTHLALRGALHAGSAEQLPAAVDEHSVAGDRITLDLSEISAIDQSGVSAIDACAQLARARDAQLEIQHPSPVTRRALADRGSS
jgi:anti-anti-sigma regulatory factor